jgi:hypothetical protein
MLKKLFAYRTPPKSLWPGMALGLLLLSRKEGVKYFEFKRGFNFWN